jgi:hypothetical protein
VPTRAAATFSNMRSMIVGATDKNFWAPIQAGWEARGQNRALARDLRAAATLGSSGSTASNRPSR